MRDFQVPKPVPERAMLVIGFLGGFEHWNDPHRGVRKVALDLRAAELPGVYVETIENRHRGQAVKLVKRALGEKGDRRIRLILYGQSLGGAAVLDTARDLQKLNIPVELTVQVDSVGLRDSTVPFNVRAAANMFQRDPLTFIGRREIHAEDPSATRILENTQLSYLFRPFATLSESDASWARRALGGSHAKMETDPLVWNHVETLILAAIHNSSSSLR
jgi:pimeloyl-ACP methyl ester carboxylesterase